MCGNCHGFLIIMNLYAALNVVMVSVKIVLLSLKILNEQDAFLK